MGQGGDTRTLFKTDFKFNYLSTFGFEDVGWVFNWNLGLGMARQKHPPVSIPILELLWLLWHKVMTWELFTLHNIYIWELVSE